MPYLLNILYLGLGASALCFVTWNLAVKVLGAVKTSVYIYMVPVITVVTSVLVLKEPVTWFSVMGTVLAVAGFFFLNITGKEVGTVNELAIRTEERIISLFPDRETLICRKSVHERESAGRATGI